MKTIATLLLVLALATAGACGTFFNKPADWARCMANEADERDAMEVINAALDRDDWRKHLDALVSLGGDAVKCLIKRAATARGAGPVETTRARRASEYLSGAQ